MALKYLVTGGAGFIGSNLVDALVSNGHSVVVLDNLFTGVKENVNDLAALHQYDIGGLGPNNKSFDSGHISGALQLLDGVDTVFHLAAMARVQPSIDDPHTFSSINEFGTLNMLYLAHLAGVRRFVFSSSSSVYGNVSLDQLPTTENTPTSPLSPYALNKLVGEEYCRMFSRVYNLETVCLRYFNVYGERQPIEGAYTLVMGAFAKQRLDGKSLTINGDGEQRRDFTYVGDVVKANIAASESSRVGAGEALNIGNGDNRSVNDIAKMIGGDTVNGPAVIEPRETLADHSLARDKLGWQPTMSLEDWMPSYKKELGL
jgi:nucleoside-diphosphate-sugar epimerase